MKTCKNCGASINDDSRFCTQCGADTFADGAQEEPAVVAEATAEPETDNAAAPTATEAPAEAEEESTVSAGEYYQPPTENASSTTSAYTYTVPVDQQPVGKGKKKGRVWAIILSVIVVLGIVIRFGLGALGIIGDVVSNSATLSKGMETSTAYINSSINLKIDATKGGMSVLTDAQKRDYFGIDPNDYETFLYDEQTDEYMYVMIAEGNLVEATTNMSKFVTEIAEYIYEGEENYKISDTYEREIAGNTFTCVDISQEVKDAYYGDYYLEQTLCFVKDATMFLEISITTYPEESGNHPQDIINTYIGANK